VKTAICLLMLAPALTATPALAGGQWGGISVPAVKDADWCRAFDPQKKDPECVFPVVREAPKPPELKPAKPRPAWILPPPEYDHPYTEGPVWIRVVYSQADVRDKCEKARLLDVALACGSSRYLQSDPSVKACLITMASKDVIEAAGYTYEVVLRHEIGHCNGWPGDHPNARPWEDWAE
jgi:hypothetical protein